MHFNLYSKTSNKQKLLRTQNCDQFSNEFSIVNFTLPPDVQYSFYIRTNCFIPKQLGSLWQLTHYVSYYRNTDYIYGTRFT
jgi:hypothetical protein